MTEFRELEIRIISAEDIKNVKLFGKMESYVVAYVDPAIKSSTHVAKKGGKNPVWNEKLNLWVPEYMLHQPNGVLMLEIYSPSSLGNELVGFIQLPLSAILGLPNASTESVNMSYQVRRPSGRSQGILNFSVRLGNKTTRENSRGPQDPVMAYPAAPYPQYQQPGGYYPQQYPPQQQFVTGPQRPQRTGRLGGAGLGLGAGLLGGLLLGDLIGSSYDYGGGFGGGGFDGGGFDGGGFDGGGFDGGGFGGGDFGGGF